jgi:hypothetical protein
LELGRTFWYNSTRTEGCLTLSKGKIMSTSNSLPDPDPEYMTPPTDLGDIEVQLQDLFPIRESLKSINLGIWTLVILVLIAFIKFWH